MKKKHNEIIKMRCIKIKSLRKISDSFYHKPSEN
jgi:hypothetical protein